MTLSSINITFFQYCAVFHGLGGNFSAGYDLEELADIDESELANTVRKCNLSIIKYTLNGCCVSPGNNSTYHKLILAILNLLGC